MNGQAPTTSNDDPGLSEKKRDDARASILHAIETMVWTMGRQARGKHPGPLYRRVFYRPDKT
jgi:hypothetical protein